MENNTTTNLYNQQIYTISDVLSKNECQNIIDKATKKSTFLSAISMVYLCYEYKER